MNEQKLRFAILGTLIGTFVLIVAMVLVWKFKFYDQAVQQLNTATTATQTAQTTAGGLAKAQKEALLAQQKLGLAQGELDYFRTRYRSLPFDLTGGPASPATFVTFKRYLNEYSSDFGLQARAQLIRAADESGVLINTNIKVDAPPQNPEDVQSPPSTFLKPQTAPLDVSITGQLGDILRFFQIINRSEILMVVGNVKLEGASPTIKASFTITPYLLASGPSVAVKPVIAGAAPAAGAPGAEGGNPEGEPPATPPA